MHIIQLGHYLSQGNSDNSDIFWFIWDTLRQLSALHWHQVEHCGRWTMSKLKFFLPVWGQGGGQGNPDNGQCLSYTPPIKGNFQLGHFLTVALADWDKCRLPMYAARGWFSTWKSSWVLIPDGHECCRRPEMSSCWACFACVELVTRNGCRKVLHVELWSQRFGFFPLTLSSFPIFWSRGPGIAG